MGLLLVDGVIIGRFLRVRAVVLMIRDGEFFVIDPG